MFMGIASSSLLSVFLISLILPLYGWKNLFIIFSMVIIVAIISLALLEVPDEGDLKDMKYPAALERPFFDADTDSNYGGSQQKSMFKKHNK